MSVVAHNGRMPHRIHTVFVYVGIQAGEVNVLDAGTRAGRLDQQPRSVGMTPASCGFNGSTISSRPDMYISLNKKILFFRFFLLLGFGHESQMLLKHILVACYTLDFAAPVGWSPCTLTVLALVALAKNGLTVFGRHEAMIRHTDGPRIILEQSAHCIHPSSSAMSWQSNVGTPNISNHTCDGERPPYWNRFDT